ncbi:uncharacterized protein BYT42DRAFT_568393 [Radiomyces spectabilis]|uniref:uncharacterized protein n=1 Tax=Radiomyces spectabilis TaxID=64574 RepID=UPI00221F844D|nr:uncharacterized protein BYT42DRAFT_568393 [Radiomyces spectabilis]KAI8379312.1 hypothetical protein BYT42DRAFT_568393 [Radiomyces spectabilis]
MTTSLNHNHAIESDEQLLRRIREEDHDTEDEEPVLGEKRASYSLETPPIVNIHGQSVRNDVLVALLDRPREMQMLAQHNADFYTALRHYIEEVQGSEAWQQFQDLVYSPREKIPDRLWMAKISQFLSHNPVFLGKFKESVGYDDEADMGADEEEDVDEEYDAFDEEENEMVSPLTKFSHTGSDFSGEHYPSHRRRQSSHNSLHFDPHPTITSPTLREGEEHCGIKENGEIGSLLTLRDNPDTQRTLPFIFPAFFRKVELLMSPSTAKTTRRRSSRLADMNVGDDEDAEYQPRHQQVCDDDDQDINPYDQFVRVLCTSRQQQPDDGAWIENVLASLDGWPNILEELLDIIQTAVSRRHD